MTLFELQESLIKKRELGKIISLEFSILRKDSELLKEVAGLFPFINSLNHGHLLYHLRDNLEEQLCSCGKSKKFYKFDKGYFATCGARECKAKSRLEKSRKTTRERYGVDHTSQLESTKAKHRQTMLDRYDCAHNFSGKLREEQYQKNLEKFGAKHALQRPESQAKRAKTMLEKYDTLNMITGEKAKATNLLKYGNKNATASDKIKEKIKESNRQTSLSRQQAKLDKFDISIIDYISKRQYYQVNCNNCDTKQTLAGCTLNTKLRLDINPCAICNPSIPSYSSKLENDLREWIESIGEKVISNLKTIVSGSELDIFLPEKGIGFEFNSLYWHSELYKTPKYHQEKSAKFLKEGVKIYHIWEDDWLYNQEKVKSRILSLLGKSTRIYARKCIIKQINGSEAREFFEKNHLDGSTGAKYAIGAFYEDQLVSVMSFSTSRFDKSGDWEIIRFASNLGLNVVGIASRLFTSFIKLVNPTRIITYAKQDWSPDPITTVYQKLGFTLVGATAPGKYWVVDGLRANRLNFMKSKLVAAGEDKKLTADQIMYARGAYKIYDSGNWKFEMTR